MRKFLAFLLFVGSICLTLYTSWHHQENVEAYPSAIEETKTH